MKRILVWDAPNMDMQLSEIFGHAPVRDERPDMGHLMNWFVDRAGGDAVIARVFVNVPQGQPANPKLHGWLRFLSARGFEVFARPKSNEDDDVDEAMLAFIAESRDEELREIIVASHDAKCFKEPLTAIVGADGLPPRVLVIGYSELINGWDDFGAVEFMDLESIPELFVNPLPRHIPLWNLPVDGKVFEPSGRPTRRSARPTRPRRVNPARSAAGQPPPDVA